jgi:hypothetical protein
MKWTRDRLTDIKTRTIRSVACAAALLAFGTTAAAAAEPETEIPPAGCTSASLYAGQDELVGSVLACPSADTVKFELASEYVAAGYCLSELHLAYGEWDSDIVPLLNKEGSPRIGKFAYATKGCETFWTFGPLAPFLKAGDFVAAHAVVTGPNDYEETAWAASPDGNNRQFNHKSWATYFKVQETGTLTKTETGTELNIPDGDGGSVTVVDPPEEVVVDYVDITIEADAKCAQCAGLDCLVKQTATVARCPSEDVNLVNGNPSGRAPNVCYTFVRDVGQGREISRGCAVAQDLRRSVDPTNDSADYTLVFSNAAGVSETQYTMTGSTNTPDCARVEDALVPSQRGCVFICDGTKDSSGCNRPPALLPVSQEITNTVNGGAIAIEGYVPANPPPSP